jgi:virginiamycin B lyase
MRITQGKMIWLTKFFLLTAMLLTNNIVRADYISDQIMRQGSTPIPTAFEQYIGRIVVISSIARKNLESIPYLKVGGPDCSATQISVSGTDKNERAAHFLVHRVGNTIGFQSLANGLFVSCPLDWTVVTLAKDFYAPATPTSDAFEQQFTVQSGTQDNSWTFQNKRRRAYLNWIHDQHLRTHALQEWDEPIANSKEYRKHFEARIMPTSMNFSNANQKLEFSLEIINPTYNPSVIGKIGIDLLLPHLDSSLTGMFLDSQFTPVLWYVKDGVAYVRTGMTQGAPQGSAWIVASGAPNNFKQVSVGPHGHVVGVTIDNIVYFREGVTKDKLEGTSWTRLTDGVAQIAAGVDGRIWGVTPGGSVLLSPAGKTPNNLAGVTWDRIDASGAIQLATGPTGEVLFLGNNGTLWARQNATPSKPEGTGWIKLASVSLPALIAFGPGRAYASQQSRILLTGIGTRIETLVGKNWGSFDGPGGTIKNITSNAQDFMLCELLDGTLWLSNLTTGWKKVDAPGAKTWKQISGSLAQISAGSDGSVWGLNAGGAIYYAESVTAPWQPISSPATGALSSVVAGQKGSVWGTNSSGAISYADSAHAGWRKVSGTLASISASPNGPVWGITASGVIYFATSATAPWGKISGTLSRLSAGPGESVWGVNSGGNIYFAASAHAPWQLIPGSLSSISVGPDGSVWGINSTGYIYCRTGVSTSNPAGTGWQEVTRAGTTGTLKNIAVAPNGVWITNTSGDIYYFSGLTP